jgi:tRNA pseudouridine32 synthase/23S rRNA pseudouridine746 synthase
MTTPALPLLHLDEHLLAVSKPAGLLAVPGRGEDKQDCLSARLQAQLPGALVVHRLDMATSGLMLMARQHAVQRSLGHAFAQGQVRKHYEAVVHGHLQAPGGEGWAEIDLPVGPDWPQRPRQQVDHVRGKPSRTRWRLLAHEGGYSRLLLEPLTGRTHQLRVHLQALGHAIVGDALYAPDGGASSSRLLLHARELQLAHPVTGEALQLRDPTPF